MPILEGKQKFEKTDVPLHRIPRMQLFLDDRVLSSSSFSYHGRGGAGGDEGRDHHHHHREVYDEDGQSLMPAPTTVSEGPSHRRNRIGKRTRHALNPIVMWLNRLYTVC